MDRSETEIELDLTKQEVAILRKQLAELREEMLRVAAQLNSHVCGRAAPILVNPLFSPKLPSITVQS